MIEIKIAETYYSEDPNQAAILRSDCEKFIEGFRKLCNETNMHNISLGTIFNCTFPTELKFDDGTSIGVSKLFTEIGFNNGN